MNGTYNMQKRWIEQHQLGWNPWKAQKSAQEMYTRIYEMKFLPPGTLLTPLCLFIQFSVFSGVCVH